MARATVGKPELLLADEPTGNLDETTSASVLDLLDQLNRKELTVVLVTHDPSVAERAGRRFVVLDGQLEELTA
ncbi:MAG: hypothetical protein FWD55_05225 [Propionibacteriaceae bacterium]|nr:hypothetical protein [Propionibacteriaceae bacterium]